MASASGTTPERDRGGHLWPMLIIGLISSVVGIALGLAIDWFPVAASEQAGPIDTLWDVLVIFSVPVFVLVEVVVLYSVYRFRMRPGEEELDGPPTHGNTRLEIVWTAIPAMILVGLCTYAYVVLTDIEKAAADGDPVRNVRVVGQQFTWTFYYEDESGEEIASSPQLYVPKDEQVHFTIQSKDVIHDFWVPAFRMKIDAVRGIDTELLVTPTRLGDYPIVCAELCGLGHAAMRQTAHVLAPADFDAWLTERAAGEGEGEGGDAQAGGPAPDGKELFVSTGCGSCHELADAGTSGGVGPALAESLAGKDAAYIEQSIVDPGAKLAEGFEDQDGIMPPSYGEQLQPAEIDALVEYLAGVTG